MKYLLSSGLCAAAFVLFPASAALADDTLHEDGTWGPEVEEPAQAGPEEGVQETAAQPERRKRPWRRPWHERRRKLPPIEVEPDASPAAPSGSQSAEADGPEWEDDGDRVRFRGGVGLDIGAYVVDGSAEMALLGIEGRLGVQFSDCFGLYATPSFWMGFGEWNVMGRVALGLVPEVTIGDVFFLGAGPELFAAGASSDDHVLGDPLNIALRTRAGFAFGRKRPGRRHAFTLALDGRLDFYEEGVGVAPTIGLGYDAF